MVFSRIAFALWDTDDHSGSVWTLTATTSRFMPRVRLLKKAMRTRMKTRMVDLGSRIVISMLVLSTLSLITYPIVYSSHKSQALCWWWQRRGLLRPSGARVQYRTASWFALHSPRHQRHRRLGAVAATQTRNWEYRCEYPHGSQAIRHWYYHLYRLYPCESLFAKTSILRPSFVMLIARSYTPTQT